MIRSVSRVVYGYLYILSASLLIRTETLEHGRVMITLQLFCRIELKIRFIVSRILILQLNALMGE